MTMPLQIAETECWRISGVRNAEAYYSVEATYYRTALLLGLIVEPVPQVVFEALFGLMHSDLATGRRGVTDTLTILRQIRSMLRLPPPMYAELNATLVEYVDGRAAAIAEWLEQFAQSASPVFRR